MNLIAILSAIDTTRVPVDALPEGVSLAEMQLRILFATVHALEPLAFGTGHAAAVPHPRSDAVTGLTRALVKPTTAVAAPAPAKAPAAPAAVEVKPEELSPAPASKDTGSDWQAAARQMIDEVEACSTLDQVRQVDAELKARLAALSLAMPRLGLEVQAKVRSVTLAFEKKEGRPARVENLGRKRIEESLQRLRNFYTQSDRQWASSTGNVSDEEVRTRMLGNPENRKVLASAEVHHPDLYLQLVEMIDAGREGLKGESS